jgi:hypothetical protein
MAMRTYAGAGAGRRHALSPDRVAGLASLPLREPARAAPRALWYKGGRVARQGTGWGGKRAERLIAAVRRESRARIAPGPVAARGAAGAPAVPTGRRAPARTAAAPQKGS